jgi:hypothetical protein
MKNAVKDTQSPIYEKYSNAKNTNTMVNAMTTKITARKLVLFRKDLQQGMTIHDALTKHGITFQDAFQQLHKYKRTPEKKTYTQIGVSQYILTVDNRYAIRKNINGKTRMFGTYDCLEDAVLVRDELIRDGWHQTHVDSICERLGVQRRTGYPNEKVRYH